MFIARSTLLLVAFVLVLPLACANDEGDPSLPGGGKPNDEGPNPGLVCPDYTANAFPEMAPSVVEKASYAPALNGAFSVSPTGSPRYSIPIEVPPGRRLAPQLEIVVDNAGVSIAGLSSIHRCGSNLAQDGELRGVQLSPEDNYCFNNSRLVQIGTGSDSIGAFAEYRMAVDSHTKIVGYGSPAAMGFDVTYFVA
jgi:hypothetical protein